jgi:Cys-rich protein (TIGR01571 family)
MDQKQQPAVMGQPMVVAAQPVAQAQQVMVQQQTIMVQQQQRMQPMMMEEAITNDLGVFGCFNNCGSCLLGWFCSCVLYGQTRERAGLQACLPAAMTIGIPMLVFYAIYGAVVVPPYMDVMQCISNNAGQQHQDPAIACQTESAALSAHSRYMYPLVFVLYLFYGYTMGTNRSALQKITNVPDEGPMNYLLAAFCFTCAVCQEHRVIERKWIQNNRQPLSSDPVMPLGTMSAGGYAQAPP